MFETRFFEALLTMRPREAAANFTYSDNSDRRRLPAAPR
jgi:hypothetical protein